MLDRLPDIVLLLAMVIAVPLVMHTNRLQWFFLDEWDYLADRRLSSADDLFRPHNGHWSTVPIVLYRLVWRAFGLRVYWPYLALALTAHLTVVALVRQLVRHRAVEPWLAVGGAVGLLYFGAGRESMAFGANVGFTGAVAFGLAAGLLADRDGPLGRRDGLAVVCGLLAVMCSGLALAILVGLGVAVAVRRGWRPALVVTAPPLIAFAAWWTLHATGTEDSGTRDAGAAIEFAHTMLVSAARSLGGGLLGGALLLTVAIGGLLLLVRGDLRQELTRVAMPAGLALSAIGFAAMTAVARSGPGFGGDSRLKPLPDSGRYQYVVVALCLPLILVGLDRLVASSRRLLLPLGVVLLLIGVPANLDRLTPKGTQRLTLGSRTQFLAVTEAPSFDRAPADLRPLGWQAPWVSVGWLRAAARGGGCQPVALPRLLLPPPRPRCRFGRWDRPESKRVFPPHNSVRSRWIATMSFGLTAMSLTSVG